MNEFTAHNIRLDDGSFTMPEQPRQMEDLPLLKFTKQFLRILFPDGAAGKRVVDLGCLEGGYTVELARAGFDALGIEVRQSNFENCQRVKAATDLPNLTFACDDVHNLAKYGVFDVVFCCGLFYHLDRPRKFIELMAQVCRRAVIIDTHVADVQPNGAFVLSDIVQNEGLTGRWYYEGEDDQRLAGKWSSWSNQKSFWVMKRDLMEALRQSGFAMVLECPIFHPYRESTHRVTIVALKDLFLPPELINILSKAWEEQASSLRRTVAAREVEVTNLRATLADREGRLEEAASEGDRLRDELCQWKAQNSSLSVELTKRTEQLNSVLQSRAWKLTAPLRAIGKLRPRSYREASQIKRDSQLIAQSGLFDVDWYLSQNPDVATHGADPIAHYLQHGALEGRDPSQTFSSKWYLDQNPDVRAAGFNPLVHYLRFGAAEGRRPFPAAEPANLKQTLAEAQKETCSGGQ